MSISEISFYGDESGSHGQGAFVLSGYFGEDDAWGAFEDEWHSVLHDSSIGGHEIEYFHMRECFKLEGAFAGFNRFQADKKLRALVDVLCPFLRSGAIREFTSIIEWDVYNRAVTGPLRQVFNNPYLFAFGSILSETARCLTEVLGRQDPIYYFLDDQIPKIEESVDFQFVTAKESLPETLGALIEGPTFRSDKLCYPLQAADLIAWQRHRKELAPAEDMGERPELKKLHNANGQRGELARYRESGLIEFSTHIEAHLRKKGLIP